MPKDPSPNTPNRSNPFPKPQGTTLRGPRGRRNRPPSPGDLPNLPIVLESPTRPETSVTNPQESPAEADNTPAEAGQIGQHGVGYWVDQARAALNAALNTRTTHAHQHRIGEDIQQRDGREIWQIAVDAAALAEVALESSASAIALIAHWTNSLPPSNAQAEGPLPVASHPTIVPHAEAAHPTIVPHADAEDQAPVLEDQTIATNAPDVVTAPDITSSPVVAAPNSLPPSDASRSSGVSEAEVHDQLINTSSAQLETVDESLEKVDESLDSNGTRRSQPKRGCKKML